MKVGDLVRYKANGHDVGHYGIIIRCIPGTSKAKVVQWMNGIRCNYPERCLEVVPCK